MKKILITLFCLCGTLMAQPYHSKELATPMHYILNFEESRTLLNQVDQDGGIAIKAAKLGKDISNAMWMPSERTIFINTSNHFSYGTMVRSIIFELQNALSSRQFDYYDQMAMEGRLSRDKYIEAIEYVEYMNVLKTVEIVNKAIRCGAFPRDAYWAVARSFDEHLFMQYQCGHSALIGYTYDSIMQEYSRAIAKKW